MRKNVFSQTEKKNPINFSQEFFKNKESKSRFEQLYENSSILNKKMDLKRAKNYYDNQERMIPVISKKAQEINRPKELFFKRLYNSNSKIIDKDTKNTKRKNEKNNNSIKNEKNNINNNDEDSLYIINNKKRNEEHKLLYKSDNSKNKNIFFLFKPIIDKNSEKIAKKIKIKSKDRLLSLSANQKKNLNNIIQKKELIKERNLKEINEKKLFKMNNNTYKPHIKDNKRKWVDKLYENGINSMKIKEEKTKKEKIKKEKEYLKYSYSPSINRNYSYTNIFKNKSYSTNKSNIKSKRTINSNRNENKSNNNNLSFCKTDIYERNKKWKNLIEEKNNKLKTKLKNNILNDSDYCFTPNLNNNIMETDISFIGKHMIEYETFLDRYNYTKYKKNLDKINYRKKNIPPKQIYPKKLVVEFVSECDSKCPTNPGTIKLTCDKRPIEEIHKNREKLKINDFFEGSINLQSNKFFKDYKLNENKNEFIIFDKNKSIGKEGLKPITKKNEKIIYRNDFDNFSFFNAVNWIINKIE